MRSSALTILLLAMTGSAHAQVTANRGVAVGGSVNNSEIRIGVSAEEIRRAIRTEDKATIAQLQRELGATRGAVEAMLAVLGEQPIPTAELPARLVKIALEVNALKAALRASEADSRAVTELKGKAFAALDLGAFDEADKYLAQLEKTFAAQQRDILIERARLLERRAALLVNGRELDAADVYQSAAGLYPDARDRLAAQYREIDALLFWYLFCRVTTAAHAPIYDRVNARSASLAADAHRMGEPLLEAKAFVAHAASLSDLVLRNEGFASPPTRLRPDQRRALQQALDLYGKALALKPILPPELGQHALDMESRPFDPVEWSRVDSAVTRIRDALKKKS